MAGRRHTFRGSRLTVAILVIAATVWGLAAWAGSLRDGGGSPAQVTGVLPGQALWTYYNTSGNPAGGGDNILTLINPNGSANSNLGNPAANTCAMIYVFNEAQGMGECCGCPLTRLASKPSRSRATLPVIGESQVRRVKTTAMVPSQSSRWAPMFQRFPLDLSAMAPSVQARRARPATADAILRTARL